MERSDSDTCPPRVEIDPLDEIRQKVKHELIALSSEEEVRIADALEMELLGDVCFGGQ